MSLERFISNAQSILSSMGGCKIKDAARGQTPSKSNTSVVNPKAVDWIQRSEKAEASV